MSSRPAGARPRRCTRLNVVSDGSSAQRFSGVISTDRRRVAILRLSGHVADRLVEQDRHLLALVLRRGLGRPRSARTATRARRARRPRCHRPSPSRSRSTRPLRDASTSPVSLMRLDRRGSSGFSWRGGRSRSGVGTTRGVTGAPAAEAERGLPRSVRGRYSAGARGGAPAAGNGLSRRECFAAGELDAWSPWVRSAARTGSRATLATRGAADGADAVTTVAGASGLCRWLCNCARFARDDSGFGGADSAGGFVTLRVIRAMDAGERGRRQPANHSGATRTAADCSPVGLIAI